MSGQEIKNALGKNIKYLRFHRQYSQAELAERADISITFLSNIERGLKFPKPDVLAKIAQSLEVEVFQLFKAEIVPNDNKEMINRFSKDISQKVNQAMESVFKQYSG